MILAPICEEPKECTNSIILGSVIAYTMHECMEQCHSHEKCRFGTFIPDKSICLLFETCIKLQYNDLCPSCQTSSPKCGRPGECL